MNLSFNNRLKVRLHLGAVCLPAFAGRTVIEGVGVRVDAHEVELTVDHSGNELAQALILGAEPDIRPDLGS